LTLREDGVDVLPSFPKLNGFVIVALAESGDASAVVDPSEVGLVLTVDMASSSIFVTIIMPVLSSRFNRFDNLRDTVVTSSSS
jgi:hypothetical protein